MLILYSHDSRDHAFLKYCPPALLGPLRPGPHPPPPIPGCADSPPCPALPRVTSWPLSSALLVSGSSLPAGRQQSLDPLRQSTLHRGPQTRQSSPHRARLAPRETRPGEHVHTYVWLTPPHPPACSSPDMVSAQVLNRGVTLNASSSLIPYILFIFQVILQALP